MNTKQTLLILLLLAFFACQPKSDQSVEESSLSKYFSVPQTISKASNISVSLRNGATFPELADASLFTLKPKIDGDWVKLSDMEFVFSPTKHLESGKQYSLTVENKNIDGVPDNPASIIFTIGVIQQDFEVVLEPLRPDMEGAAPIVSMSGVVNTADISVMEDVQKMLTLTQGDHKVEWRSETASKHKFTISNIERKEASYSLGMTWSGKSIGVDRKEELPIRIPSLKEFEILSVRVEGQQTPYVSIHFTDALDTNQDMAGLVELEGEKNPRLVIDRNEIKVYLSQKLTGQKKLTVFQGLKNKLGYGLETKLVQSVSFDAPKPELRLVGQGSILPSTKGLHLPFEAIGLQSVQVRVVRMHENNLPIFFQSNEWDGNNEVVRIGKVVFEGGVKLKNDNISLSDWNRQHLDLSRLFEAEKGAMYRIELSIRPTDALNGCITTENTYEEQKSTGTDWSIYKNDGFSYYGSYNSWYYPPGYEWSERENPCHVSYYNYERTVSTNLLATDIGLLAKIGSDNQLNVYSTSLSSAAPIVADIKVLDFQLQELANGKTDGNGFYSTTPNRRPFLVVANAAGQKSYLKLADGTALSTSNFDVSGQQVSKGLKGFIYGERDVWRPGDDIFLSFILEDDKNSLPSNYPITFELRDPSGNLKDEQVSTLGVMGIYAFKTKTSTEDITGNWQATVSAGNAKFSRRVKIEAIKPNRLKIELGFDNETYYKSDGDIKGQLSAKWLTGIKAPQLQAQVTLGYRPVATQFAGFPQFSFDLAGSEFSEEPKMIVDQKTDQEGNLGFNVKIPDGLKPPGKLRLRLETKVFEPGGGFSIFGKSLDYMPYRSFAGVKVPEGDEYGYLKRDASHQFEIAAVTDKGQPTSQQIKVEVFKLGWRWWWDQQYDYEASYITSGEQKPLLSRLVSVSNGKATFAVNGKDMEWGRHMVVVTDILSGHKASKTFYMGWSEGEKTGVGASFLSITTNKDEYKTGEKIEVTLPSSVSGKALITVENGSSVLEQFWVDTQNGRSSFTTTATADMAPNIFLNVTLLQPHANTENDLPIRTYGILPLKVFDPSSILSPEIKMADEMNPGKSTKITISEKSGQPMAYTLAIVDEGLLDITGFKTPDLWNHFYQKEALGVKSWDLYDHVLGAYGGRLERLLAIGGGDELNRGAGGKRDNRFEPIVKYLGPFELSKGQKRDHDVLLPPYIGSVKVMVVAANKGKYGKSDKVVPVTQPLMVLGTLPRVLGPGESVQLPVNVLRLKSNLNNAAITVKAEGVVKLVGDSKQNVALASESNTVYFNLTTENKTGAGKVIITATSDKEKAEHVINIESRLSNPSVTETIAKRLAKGETYEQKVVPYGVEGTNSATLTLSQMPDFHLDKRLKYLIQYPHGCVEQVTSSAFPQVFLDELTLLPLERKIQVEQNIKAAIARLQRFQTHEGGLAYWPGSSETTQWGSIYATHFLVEAQKKGYYISPEFMKKLIGYQKKQATAWWKSNTKYNDDLVQGYRLYVLAQAGEADISAMNRMRNLPAISQQAKERLATAYAITGRKEIAQELLKTANTNTGTYEYWYTYGSEERDLAMRLETYVFLEDHTAGFGLLQTLANKMASGAGMNTHATAYSLLAISKFASKQTKSTGIDATVSYNGKKEDWKTTLSMQSGSLPAEGSKSLSITNKGDGDMFITITQTGTPLPGNEKAVAQDLALTIQYENEAGSGLNVENMSIGTNFRATATVRNNSAGIVRNIALTHIIPSGWEINNTRLNAEESEKAASDFMDIRDDRVFQYFDLRPGQSRSFTINLTAAYAGKFYLPAISAEAMYETSRFARTEGRWIEVVK